MKIEIFHVISNLELIFQDDEEPLFAVKIFNRKMSALISGRR